MKEIILWFKETFGIDDNICELLQPAELLPALNSIRQKCENDERIIKELSSSLDFYKEAINSHQNPIFIKDDEHKFVFVNEKYCNLFNVENDKVVGKQVSELDHVSAKDKAKYLSEDSQVLQNKSLIQYEQMLTCNDKIFESKYRSKGFEVASTGKRGLIGEIVNISDEKRLQRELEKNVMALKQLLLQAQKDSKMDPATNVYNRLVFVDELPDMLEQMSQNDISICGFLADIDNFKYINDTYGHLAGDEVVIKFAKLMQSTIGLNDMVIRYGGDEFIAIMFSVSLNTAREIAENFRKKVSSEIILPGKEVVTTSIGLTHHIAHEHLSKFLFRMDEGMYQSKKFGKNRVSIT